MLGACGVCWACGACGVCGACGACCACGACTLAWGLLRMQCGYLRLDLGLVPCLAQSLVLSLVLCLVQWKARQGLALTRNAAKQQEGA